jgi:hypothetical protein
MELPHLPLHQDLYRTYQRQIQQPSSGNRPDRRYGRRIGEQADGGPGADTGRVDLIGERYERGVYMGRAEQRALTAARGTYR